ncbi:MAG: carbohydrate ABC transporter permease [Verrucomicrobiae bacterium]|nr:carbohydrate ABC transporter permease [Verrucomicrobiae bacterium]
MAKEEREPQPTKWESTKVIRQGHKTGVYTAGVESKGSWWARLFSYVFLLTFAITMVYPFLFMVATSLRSDNTMNTAVEDPIDPIKWKETRFENYARVFKEDERTHTRPFLRYYVNSLVVTLLITFGQVATSALAAYAFARLEFPGRDLLFLGYLATMMIPFVVTMIPNYILLSKLPDYLNTMFHTDYFTTQLFLPGGVRFGRAIGIDSYFALTVPCMFSASGTFLLRQFFMTLPKDLEEAAKIDGCGLWRIFTTVILPLSKPALATVSIFTFMAAWMSFLWPLIVTNSEFLKVLPVGLTTFKGLYTTQWNLLMAASVMMILPMVVVFLFGQRYFISGITMGAVKG